MCQGVGFCFPLTVKPSSPLPAQWSKSTASTQNCRGLPGEHTKEQERPGAKVGRQTNEPLQCLPLGDKGTHGPNATTTLGAGTGHPASRHRNISRQAGKVASTNAFTCVSVVLHQNVQLQIY